MTFLKAHSGLVTGHPTFGCLEECGNVRLAVQVARVIAGANISDVLSTVGSSASALSGFKAISSSHVLKRKREA